MSAQKKVPRVEDLLRDSPKNWGKWGPNDEVGSLNYLTRAEVLRGISAVKKGQVFTLQVRMGDPAGDPLWPGRQQPTRVNLLDKGHYLCGKGAHFPGEAEFSDDLMIMSLQGSTQYDALGHAWCGDQLWNGYDARTTSGRMEKASVLAIAERGVVGRGVLIDIARHRGKSVLERGETFTHVDVEAAARAQGVTIEKHDILVIRTGWIGSFYKKPREEFFRDYIEPGLTYSPELVNWFHRLEIPNLVTDTMANEVTIDPVTGVGLPLHNALMRNLGVNFTEIVQLDALADDCVADGQWSFLYAAAPLKIVGGTGAPVNPIVIK
jgi:kynurenine formamidase